MLYHAFYFYLYSAHVINGALCLDARVDMLTALSGKWGCAAFFYNLLLVLSL